MSKLHVPMVDREHAPTASHDHVRTAARHKDSKTTKSTRKTLFGVVASCRRGSCVSRRLCVAAFASLLASGACVTTTGEPVVQRPPLDVPPAPPRIITPLPLPEPPPVEIPPEDTGTVAKPPAPSKPRPPATNKPEAKPVEPPPVEPPPVPPVPTAPPPTLSTPPQGDANALTRQIRDSIERTRRALEKIDYGTQSRERKKAYDDAKLFATQAEEAIKETNLVFAKELADKAERLAKELQSR